MALKAPEHTTRHTLTRYDPWIPRFRCSLCGLFTGGLSVHGCNQATSLSVVLAVIRVTGMLPGRVVNLEIQV